MTDERRWVITRLTNAEPPPTTIMQVFGPECTEAEVVEASSLAVRDRELEQWRHQAHLDAVKVASRDSLIDQLSETQLAKDVTVAEARVGELQAALEGRDRELERLKSAAQAILKRHGDHHPMGSWRTPGHKVIEAEWAELREALAARPDEGDRT